MGLTFAGGAADDARLDALESGDAWSNKTTGYVPVVQSDGSIAWEAASGGGGTDLSAVDQDVNVENGHVIDFRSTDFPGDSEAHGSLGWDDDSFGVVYKAEPGADSFLGVQDPENSSRGVLIGATSNGALTMTLSTGATYRSLVLQASGLCQLQGGDLQFDPSKGPAIRSPNGTYYRLIVANDGTLSTEEVV